MVTAKAPRRQARKSKAVLQPWERVRRERGRKYLKEQYNRPDAYWIVSGARWEVYVFRYLWGLLALATISTFYLIPRFQWMLWVGIALTCVCTYLLYWGYKRVTSE